MRAVIGIVVLLGTSSVAAAQTGSSFLTSDGLNRAPVAVLHCVGPGNVALPCGTAGQPLIVNGGANSATAANQAIQVQTEQAISTAFGSQQDSAYAGGAGSTIALLKGLVAALTNGVIATPIAGVPVSRSIAVTSALSTTLFSTNLARHYLAFQAPVGTSIWVNFLGGPAGPNAADCALLSAGTLYESGQFVTRGSVTIYSPVAVTVSAWEG